MTGAQLNSTNADARDRTIRMDRFPKDSRQRYTKQSLYDAFLGLLGEKAVSDITVVEICARAGISRKTFYKYYVDQFALLAGMQNDLFADYRERVAREEPNIYQITPMLIRWADANRALVKAIFANRAQGNFIDRLCDDLFELYHERWQDVNPTMSAESVEALFYYVVSGLTGIIRHWLVDQPDTPVERVIAHANMLLFISEPNRKVPLSESKYAL